MPTRDPKKIKEYNQEYYKKNKESILKKQKEKNEKNPEIRQNMRKKEHVIANEKRPILCETCNTYIQKKSMSRHKKSKSHLQKIINID